MRLSADINLEARVSLKLSSAHNFINLIDIR